MKVFNKSFLFGTYNVTEQIDGFFLLKITLSNDYAFTLNTAENLYHSCERSLELLNPTR
jgi:hypothetical protein